jgi:hypothetical protein
VKRLGERIEQWRRTRECRTAMPGALWSEAVSLARSEGAYRVARALRINFEGLKRRLAEEAATGVATTPGAFVELSGAQLLGASAPSGAVVELSDPAGVRLTVWLSNEAALDVAQVVAAFRQDRP